MSFQTGYGAATLSNPFKNNGTFAFRLQNGERQQVMILDDAPITLIRHRTYINQAWKINANRVTCVKSNPLTDTVVDPQSCPVCQRSLTDNTIGRKQFYYITVLILDKVRGKNGVEYQFTKRLVEIGTNQIDLFNNLAQTNPLNGKPSLAGLCCQVSRSQVQTTPKIGDTWLPQNIQVPGMAPTNRPPIMNLMWNTDAIKALHEAAIKRGDQLPADVSMAWQMLINKHATVVDYDDEMKCTPERLQAYMAMLGGSAPMQSSQGPVPQMPTMPSHMPANTPWSGAPAPAVPQPPAAQMPGMAMPQQQQFQAPPMQQQAPAASQPPAVPAPQTPPQQQFQAPQPPTPQPQQFQAPTPPAPSAPQQQQFQAPPQQFQPPQPQQAAPQTPPSGNVGAPWEAQAAQGMAQQQQPQQQQFQTPPPPAAMGYQAPPPAVPSLPGANMAPVERPAAQAAPAPQTPAAPAAPGMPQPPVGLSDNF